MNGPARDAMMAAVLLATWTSLLTCIVGAALYAVLPYPGVRFSMYSGAAGSVVGFLIMLVMSWERK